MRSTVLRTWCLGALGAVVFAGCGGGEDERDPVYPVTGTVTRNGTALEGAVVTFVPQGEGAKAATGTTDASGKYTLTTWAQGDGAQVGSYRVTVTKYDSPAGQPAAGATPPPDADPNSLVLQEEYPAGYNEMEAGDQPPSKNMLPPKFADPSQSGFTAEVTEDESKNVFEFNIPG